MIVAFSSRTPCLPLHISVYTLSIIQNRPHILNRFSELSVNENIFLMLHDINIVTNSKDSFSCANGLYDACLKCSYFIYQ